MNYYHETEKELKKTGKMGLGDHVPVAWSIISQKVILLGIARLCAGLLLYLGQCTGSKKNNRRLSKTEKERAHLVRPSKGTSLQLTTLAVAVYSSWINWWERDLATLTNSSSHAKGIQQEKLKPKIERKTASRMPQLGLAHGVMLAFLTLVLGWVPRKNQGAMCRLSEKSSKPLVWHLQ